MEIPNDTFWGGVAFAICALLVLILIGVAVSLAKSQIEGARQRRREIALAEYMAERELLKQDIRTVVESILGEEDESEDDGTDNSLGYQPGR